MSTLARSVHDRLQLSGSPLFAGNHVHLDEVRWTPTFEAKVNSWASSQTLLFVLASGQAMLIAQTDGRASFESPRPMELCGVFRFDDVASGTAGVTPAPRRLVQLKPKPLLRYYWRRQALALGYPDPAAHVEEDAIGLLRHAVSLVRSEARTGAASMSPGRSRHRTLARNAKTIMALSIADPHPIAQVARALDTSPFHLARVFRTEVGGSPHKYLMQLRLISALVQLRAGARDLSKLALELGFCHHSHFTRVFHQALGYTPREVRRMLTAQCIGDLGIVARCSALPNTN